MFNYFKFWNDLYYKGLLAYYAPRVDELTFLQWAPTTIAYPKIAGC